jgi:hypothetical protein
MPRLIVAHSALRIVIAIATAVLVSILLAARAAADTPSPIPPNADWRTTVNFYRAIAGLPGVTENATYSDGDLKHSKYVAEQSWITHYEDPCSPPQYTSPPFPDCASTGRTPNPWYTPEGDAAGQNGNVILRFGNPVTCPDRQSVEGWMAGPFHAVGIVDPRLQTSGYASWVAQTGTYANIRCAATLDVLRGLTGSAPTGPVYYPGNGTTTPLLSYSGGEQPDPLASTGCSSFTTPTGPAILLQLPATPAPSTVTLTDNGTTVPSCSFDENTYTNSNAGLQSLGRAVLAQRHAIAIIPQSSLTSTHVYGVTVQIGGTQYAWSFTACAAGQNGQSCSGPTAVVLKRATATRTRGGVLVRWRTSFEARTLGFDLYRVENGTPVKVNHSLIPSAFGGTSTGLAYAWLDRRAADAGVVRYGLRAIRLDGTQVWLGTFSTAR